MNSILLILLVEFVNLVFTAYDHPAHLKRFGSVGSLIHIQELNRQFPTVSELFTYYLPESEPVLSRQVLNEEDPHYSVWQTDEQLINQVYGLAQTNIQVEAFISRQRQRLQMTFEDFLRRYGKEPLLFADKVPVVLQKYASVPRPLQCDPVLETLQSAILLINGINASPLLFQEKYDHFHCILRGSKRLVLVNTRKYPDVRKIVMPEKRDQHMPPVNPDRVDLDQFPALAEVDYHLANLTSGDCLFIPSGWIFQERSLENTMAVIYNIKHQLALTIDAEEFQTCPEYDQTFTLDQIDWSTEREPTSFKDVIRELTKDKPKKFDKWRELFSKHLTYDIASDPEASAIFEEFYDIIDMDADGLISAVEIEKIDGQHEHHIGDILFELTKVIRANRKSTTFTPEDVQEEEEEATENEEQTNYKTDL